MKPELSIVMPGIRPERWEGVYASILKSTKRSFELIIASPLPLPPNLHTIRNLKFVKDWGSPVRASCIASLLCEGKDITWTADDAVYLPDALDKNLALLDTIKDQERGVVVAKYFEGEGGNKPLHDDEYFKINGSPATAVPSAEDSYWLFNVAIMKLDYFNYLGGWDCRYEATFMSHTDLALRAQNHGASVHMSDAPLLDCGHMPGHSGDHGPIHDAQTTHDEPLFKSMHKKTLHHVVSSDNWKNSPALWGRRFK